MNCVESQIDEGRRASVADCPVISSEPALQQASNFSCQKNCVVHQLEADRGLKTGSDSLNQTDKWNRTDFEPEQPPNFWGQSYCEPTPQSSTWDRPQPLHLGNNNGGHRCEPDQSFRNLPCPENNAGGQYASRPSHGNQQRPTILVIVVNKAAIPQSGNNNFAPGPMSYQEQPNQKYVHSEKRRSYQNKGATCNCCNAANQAYSSLSETSQFQEQRASNRQNDFGFSSNRLNCCEPGCGAQTPNGSMGRGRRDSQSRWQHQQFWDSNSGVDLMTSDRNVDCQSISSYNNNGSGSDPGITGDQSNHNYDYAVSREDHFNSDTETSIACQCKNRCDCESVSEIGDLERTLETAMMNQDCQCNRPSQLALGMKNENKMAKKKKKKRKPRSPFDRFTSPPFVIEPKPQWNNCCCNRFCCTPHCGCHCRCY